MQIGYNPVDGVFYVSDDGVMVVWEDLALADIPDGKEPVEWTPEERAELMIAVAAPIMVEAVRQAEVAATQQSFEEQ